MNNAVNNDDQLAQSLGRVLRPSAKVLPEHARAHNRALVLQHLFHEGPGSRADLARVTGLTRVTVSDLVSDLEGEGFVEELGPRTGSRVGKPATLVGLRKQAFRIIGIEVVDEVAIRGAVMDLSGKIHERQDEELKGRRGNDAVEAVVQICHELAARSSHPILGVGVGAPGVISPNGVVIEAPKLRWIRVPLAEVLSERLQLPVHVGNDANAAALGEHTFSKADSTGLMVLRVGTGIGAGILLDGALLLGHHFAAGEIGHVTVTSSPTDGELCACGRRGCLETVFGIPALRRDTEGLGPKETDAALASAGQRLGNALAPVVSALNLREVLVSGPTQLLEGVLLEATLRTIRERSISSVSDDLEIRMSSLGEDVVLMGAAVLVLSGQLGVS